MGGDSLQGARHYASKGETLLSLTDFTRGDIKGRVGGRHCTMATLLDEKLQKDSVVGERMHYETSCLTGLGCREIHSVMLRDGNMAKIAIASCHDDMSCLRGERHHEERGLAP